MKKGGRFTIFDERWSTKWQRPTPLPSNSRFGLSKWVCAPTSKHLFYNTKVTYLNPTNLILLHKGNMCHPCLQVWHRQPDRAKDADDEQHDSTICSRACSRRPVFRVQRDWHSGHVYGGDFWSWSVHSGCHLLCLLHQHPSSSSHPGRLDLRWKCISCNIQYINIVSIFVCQFFFILSSSSWPQF